MRDGRDFERLVEQRLRVVEQRAYALARRDLLIAERQRDADQRDVEAATLD